MFSLASRRTSARPTAAAPAPRVNPAITWRLVAVCSRFSFELILTLALRPANGCHSSIERNYDQDNVLPNDAYRPDNVPLSVTEEAAMPYPRGHREATRRKIVDSARRLFNQHGFDNVSVKQIMACAGMTHGAFYAYFKGKSALYSEVLSCFLTDPNWQPRWEGIHVDLAAADAGTQIIRAYLSQQHFDDVENSCPMVALPTDVRRNGAAVRSAFETVFLAMVRLLERSLSGSRRERHEKAQGIAALCVGGLVVSRALRTQRVADELRAASMSVALELATSRSMRTGKRPPRSRAIRMRAEPV
jgi:TetR/AcrR family transcriptional regulator, transcriptional repressor for nem operon